MEITDSDEAAKVEAAKLDRDAERTFQDAKNASQRPTPVTIRSKGTRINSPSR